MKKEVSIFVSILNNISNLDKAGCYRVSTTCRNTHYTKNMLEFVSLFEEALNNNYFSDFEINKDYANGEKPFIHIDIKNNYGKNFFSLSVHQII
jgi:hypothetical protein